MSETWNKLTDATMRAWTKQICDRTGETHEEVLTRFEREAAERRKDLEREEIITAAEREVIEAALAGDNARLTDAVRALKAAREQKEV